MIQAPLDQELPVNNVEGTFEGVGDRGHGDHELSNGMMVASGLQHAFPINWVIDLATEQLQQTYEELYDEWYALYEQTGLKQIVREVVQEHLERENPIGYCYFLTPQWTPTHPAISRGPPENLMDKDRRQANPKELLAISTLAIFMSIADTICKYSHLL